MKRMIDEYFKEDEFLTKKLLDKYKTINVDKNSGFLIVSADGISILKGSYERLGTYDRSNSLWIWNGNMINDRGAIDRMRAKTKEELELNIVIEDAEMIETLHGFVRHDMVLMDPDNFDMFLKFLIFMVNSHQILINKMNDHNRFDIYLIRDVMFENRLSPDQ